MAPKLRSGQTIAEFQEIGVRVELITGALAIAWRLMIAVESTLTRFPNRLATVGALSMRLLSRISRMQGDRMRRLLLAMTMMLCVSDASAEQIKTSREAGVGAIACSQFTADIARDPNMEKDYLSWAQGFMSSFNLLMLSEGSMSRDLSGTSVDEQRSYIKQYCGTHPGEEYSVAVMKLLATLPNVK